MDKTEFCYRLQEAFTSLRERNFESVVTEYETVLTGEIDYQQLYNLFMSEWDKNYRPMPCDLKPYVSRAKIYKQQDMTDEKKRDLYMVTKWFNSDEWQWHHKPIPDHIRITINQHNFSDDLLNRTMASDEFRKWLNNA